MPFAFGNQHVIQKVIKNNNDEIIAYALENGDIIMKEEAIGMVSQGLISGVTIEADADGNEYLKSAFENF